MTKHARVGLVTGGIGTLINQRTSRDGFIVVVGCSSVDGQRGQFG